VRLKVTVDRDGKVGSVSVARSLSKALDKQAADAVRKWKFEPAKKDGHPVAVLLLVEVNFRCEEPTGQCQIVQQEKKNDSE
jgi:protein TonB